ncbi:MAG: aldo/keto reductase, partial [Chloroflexota bacterium]|nr:aldo/keto reductase [Chloroflexota bacterium]
MDFTNLGKAGLKVSKLCLGTMIFGSTVNETESISIIHRAIDDGINFIDTANGYNNGLTERIVGKALEGRRN